MSSTNEIIEIPLSQLEVHPVNRQIYVSDPARKAELLESIRENGILEPLVVMPRGDQFLILSGARRFHCAKELGYETAPCIVTMVKDPVLAIIEHNKYRQKTPIEIYNEAQMLRKILEPKAEKRMLAGTPVSNLTQGDKGRVRDIVAEKLNVSSGYLAMLEQVVEHRHEVPDVVRRLETGRETVYSAYKQLKAKIRPQVEIPGIFIGQYFAGKQNLVKDIIARIPPHHCYAEPFGGFCSVLLNKTPSPVEVYNDFNKDVVNLLTCLKEYPFELISELYLMPHSRWLFEQLIGVLNDPFEVPDVERAAKWYYLNESCFAGLHNRPPTPGSWSHGVTRNHAKKLRNRLSMLLSCSRRLLNVQIENRSYEYVLENYDSPDTFFYVDPPYYETDNVFGVDFAPSQHEELRNRLGKVQGKWLLTYNDHPKVREFYRNFDIEKVVVQHSAYMSKATVREYYTHLLISNFKEAEA